jgi:hypothetical protein
MCRGSGVPAQACYAGRMSDIPWDREVELFQARGRQMDLRVTRTKMSLRDALDAFLNLPTNEQGAAGIALNEPIREVVDGRGAFIGWYNAAACRELAKLLPIETERSAEASRMAE